MGLFGSRKKSSAVAPVPPPSGTALEHDPLADEDRINQTTLAQIATIFHGDFYGSVKVAGTSNYQGALGWASDNHQGGLGQATSLARIEFEPDNPYDKKAIRVTVGGRLIGYIARSDQAEIAPVVRSAIKKHGEATCVVRFVGGGADKSIGARLCLFAPESDDDED